MKGKRLRSAWFIFLCYMVFYTLLSFSGILDKQKIWPSVELSYENDQRVFSLEAHDAYGIKTNGPYTELPPGTYRLKWQIESDGANTIHLSSSNDVAIEPASLAINPGTFEGEASFEVPDTLHNFRINVEFHDGTYLNIHNLRLYSPVYTDNYFTLAALISVILLLWQQSRAGRLPQSRREILFPLAAAVIFASIPVLRENTIFTHDTPFHAARLHNLLDSLRAGQFPGRVGGYTYNGYGAVTSVFYPDYLLYPAALLLHLGASITYVLNAVFLAINVLTAVCMYLAAKRIFSDKSTGVFAAILYVCNGFRLERLYGSFMLGQILAMAFVPLFFLGLWEVFWGDKRRWPVLVIGATLVFQSHMLSTILCGGIAALGFLFCLRNLVHQRRLTPIMLAIAVTVLLNLTTIVPLITTYCSGVTTSVNTYGFVDLTHEFVQLLGVDKELGLAILIGIIALLCLDAPSLSKHSDIIRLLLLGCACLWMCTDLFPWSYVFALTNGLPEILQFPWRFLVIASLCLSMCAGVGYAHLLPKAGIRGTLAVLSLAILCAAPVIERALNMDMLEFGQDGSPYILTPEYQFEGTNLEITRSRELLADGDVLIEQYKKEGTGIHAYVSAQEDASISFPLFGFDGYAATVDGQRLDWVRGQNNRLTVLLPAGTQGQLSVHFEGNRIWLAADAVSVTAFVLFLAYCARGKFAHLRQGKNKQI